MPTKTYQGSFGEPKVPTKTYQVSIKLDLKLSLETGEDGKTPVAKSHIGAFSVDDIDLVPLSSENFGNLEEMMKLPNAPGIGAKKAVWAPRGNEENIARCFMAIQGGKPLGYFNIGTSKININHEGSSYTPSESSGFNGGLDPLSFAKVVYASSCYYDMVQNLNATSFGSHVIYTTKDESIRDALLTAGWEKPDIGDSFFDALTSIEAEVDDGRGPRFKVEEGQFMERYRVADDTEQRWHYGYEPKELLVHKIGDFFDSFNLVAGEA